MGAVDATSRLVVATRSRAAAVCQSIASVCVAAELEEKCDRVVDGNGGIDTDSVLPAGASVGRAPFKQAQLQNRALGCH